MLKEILKIKGVTFLAKKSQLNVFGGIMQMEPDNCVNRCSSDSDCPQRGSRCETYECGSTGQKQCTRGN